MNHKFANTFARFLPVNRTALMIVCLSGSILTGLGAFADKSAGDRLSQRSSPRKTPRLESLLVDVNGERRRVEPMDGFAVVRGDLLTIIDAWFVDRAKAQLKVDIVGLLNKGGKNGLNEVGRVIDTGRDFDPRLSENGRGERYKIRVFAAGVLHGEATLIIERPRLISFDVAVNGERQTIREGEKLSLSAHDGVRVLEIRTNIRGNENVRHDLSTDKGADGRLKREIRFKRGGAIFAKIPIEWRGS